MEKKVSCEHFCLVLWKICPTVYLVLRIINLLWKNGVSEVLKLKFYDSREVKEYI